MLETPRLRLRRWLPRDEAPFAAMNADPEAMQYFPALITPEQSRMAIGMFEANFEKHGYSFWAVELKDDHAFVGSIGLEPYDLKLNSGEIRASHVAIGWQLVRAYWGQGLAFEATQAVMEDAANRIHLDEVIAVTHESNLRSARLCERLDMQCDRNSPIDDRTRALGHPLRRQLVYRRLLVKK